MAKKPKKRDPFSKSWIIENALDEIPNYEKGILTLRGLHYRLVSRGMTNTIQHYKRVINAMTEARWDGLVDFDVFADNDRGMIGKTDYTFTDLEEKVESTNGSIRYWMENYYKNRWENQMYYPEVFIEKKALQGVFSSVCEEWEVALGACKGYPSLTFLHQAKDRFIKAFNEGFTPIILYFGDYDPSGEDIPRSIEANLHRLGIEVEVRRFALLESDVLERNLPPAPIKVGDSRSATWDGLGQVELDAVEPRELQGMCEDAIRSVFKQENYDALLEQEAEEKIK
jgi:hypothetical protein